MSPDRLVAASRKALRRVRGAWLGAWVRAWGGRVGRHLEVEKGVTLRWEPHAGLVIGDDIRLGRGVVIDAPAPAELTMGDRVKVMHYTVIAAAHHVTIGADCQIAEHCSIRDADHGLDLGRPFADQLVAGDVHIGEGAWIARGVAVLRGSTVGSRAVVGANSVVRGLVPPRTVAVGAPAGVIRTLDENS